MLGPSVREQFERMFPADKLWPVNEYWEDRFMKNPYATVEFSFAKQEVRFAEELYGQARGLDDFIFKAMSVHAESLQAEADHSRCSAWKNSGFMNWMFSDIWPSGTWAVIDHSLQPKQAYYRLKRCYAPLRPAFAYGQGGETGAYVLNDTREDFAGRFVYGEKRMDGSFVWKKEEDVRIPAGGHVRIGAAPCAAGDYLYGELLCGGARVVKEIVSPTMWADTSFESDYTVRLRRDGATCLPTSRRTNFLKACTCTSTGTTSTDIRIISSTSKRAKRSRCVSRPHGRLTPRRCAFPISPRRRGKRWTLRRLKCTASNFCRSAGKRTGRVTDGASHALYPLCPAVFEKPARAVMTDLDGTTLSSEMFWVYVIECTMRELLGDKKFGLEEADLPFVCGYTTAEHLRYCIGKYAPGKSLAEANAIYHRAASRELDAVLRGEGNTGSFVPAPGLKEFLLALKKSGVKIGLATSGLEYKAVPEIAAVFRTIGLGDPPRLLRRGHHGRQTQGQRRIRHHRRDRGEAAPFLYSELACFGLHEPDPRRVIGIEDSAAGVLSLRFAGYAVLGVNGGTIAASGLDALCLRKRDSLADFLDDIL